MNAENTVNIKAFSPDGYPVYLTLTVDRDNIGESVNRILADLKAANLMPREQGVEQGENVDTLAKFSIRSKQNDDNTSTPVIDIFVDESHNQRTISLYLNTAEQIADFERLTGYKLAACKVNIGKNPAQEDDAMTKNTIYRVEAHPRFVWEKNPEYDETKAWNEQAKKGTPKRKFVRWMLDASVASTPPAGNEMPTKAQALFEGKRRPAIENAVSSNLVTFTVREIVVGKSGNQSFLDFHQPLPDDGSPAITARYWGKTGQRLEGLKEAIGSAEWSSLATAGTVSLEFPVDVTAKREGAYWSAIKVSSSDINF